MNQTLQKFARKTILELLERLTPENRKMFNLLYGRNDGKRSVEDACAMSMEDVVKEIPEEKLDWAMKQVENTLKKNWTGSTGN